MKNALTTSHVKELLGADTVSRRDGVYTARWEFFYTHGVTAGDKVNVVKKQLPKAAVVDSGEVWKAFRGGASTAQSSHWYVKFTLPY